jgi:eukaryotic-like serine/threonine-protein kinase
VTLAAGSRLGPYEILGPIGAGGMGEVYRARDPRLGRDVAIKVLPASFSADPDRLRRFEQEARAAGVLNHPNITAVYDIGSVDSAPYVVQELLEGETLRAELAGGRFSPRKAIDYATQIARGLAAAHEKAIVHRDLKPENLFVTRDGRVKILDFGLAKLTQQDGGAPSTNLPTETRGTEPGVVLGTLGYMSPEQVRGQSTDARSDIFSFGAVLYEMLSGKRAFQGDSAADTMSAILREEPPDLSATNQNVSPVLERIVRHCLEKKPEQRFHSAHDVGFALDAITGTSTPSAIGAVEPAGRKRIPWLPIGAIGGLAALAAAAWLLASRPRAAEPPTYRLLTFRRGTVQAARFAPDGQTVIYSAAWEGSPTALYQARIGLTESLPLGVARSGKIAGITDSGEMAAIFDRVGESTLARLPITGGVPRDVAESIASADISKDGRALAVVRWLGGAFALEYPIGKTLYKTSGEIGFPRISPDGERVAFFDQPLIGDDRGSLAVVGKDGRKTTLTREWASAAGIAWHPNGEEIWFTATDHGANLVVRAVSLSGKERRILPGPGRLILHDIAPDGRLLLEERAVRRALMFGSPARKPEIDLSWLDYSTLTAISRDGSQILMGETGEGGGPNYGVYIRKTDGSPAVRLGEGIPDSLSPDGKWAVVLLEKPKPAVALLPLGAGEPRTLPDFGLRVREAKLLPDGKRIFLAGARPNQPLGVFLADIDTGKVTKIGPDAIGSPSAVSPDGKLLFTTRSDGRAFLYPIDADTGVASREITAFEQGEWPAGWSGDGRHLFLCHVFTLPLRVYRVDLAADRRELWREFNPADATGTEGLTLVMVAEDGQSYAYTYSRSLSELFVVEGVK